MGHASTFTDTWPALLQDEHIHDAVDDLRAKHKAITAMLSNRASGGASRTAGPPLDFLEF
jgi:hypothetical protein